MKFFGTAALLIALSSPTWAQTPPPDAPPPPPAAAPAPVKHGAKFEAANTTNDGKLTLAQAQAANWRPVVKNFDAIDRDHKGYVTKQDIHDWHKAQHAAKTAPPPPAPAQ